MYFKFTIVSIVSASFFFVGCKESPEKELALLTLPSEVESEAIKKRELSQEFKDYWYTGKAEITSYNLKQARYGELREGTAVTIFVTEDFLPDVQVKANTNYHENIPVLKLNSTKKFLTGIYPYSIMTSTFSPVRSKEHALKVSNSVQEWCGHVYAQLNNKKEFEISSHSYFEGEADQALKLPKTWLENELWNLIRIDPKELPLGKLEIIPSFDYLRLGHKKLKAYQAILSMKKQNTMQVYTIHYPELNRNLTIYFENKFPYSIEKWEETYISGYGQEAKTLTTSATKIERIKSAYWFQNNNSDNDLRGTLGLDR